MNTLEFLKSHVGRENSMLNIIRAVEDDQDIIDTLIELRSRKAITFTFGGSHPSLNALLISIPPARWESEHKNNVGARLNLKAAYAYGTKKAEILRIRHIMWTVMPKFYDCDETGSHGNIPPAWTYVRTNDSFWDAVNEMEK